MKLFECIWWIICISLFLFYPFAGVAWLGSAYIRMQIVEVKK